MVGVLQMLPQTVRVEFTTEYNRESGSFALINYEYRDAEGKIQRVRFPVHADDGLYHYPETGAFGKAEPQLLEKCGVSPYLITR